MRYSVIIPVYQAEKTLNRCVDSLLAENYTDCEIILVNDGSKDRSGEICQAYADRCANVVYIEKENGGVSTARNAGLDLARGEYIVFVDSDDYVMPGFFEAMDSERDKTDADLVMFSYTKDSGEIKAVSEGSSTLLSGREALMPAVNDAICRKTINMPWAKRYKRCIIEEKCLRFPVGASVAEDRVFNICYSFYINNIQISNRTVYCVNTENENSLSRKRHDDLQEQFLVTRRYFENALDEALIPENEKEQYRRAVNFGDCRYIYHEAKLLLADQVGWLERQKKLGRKCDAINRRHMKYPSTRYCTLITLPVRLRLTWVIDVIAWKLTH